MRRVRQIAATENSTPNPLEGQHFSQFTDEGLDTAATMRQLRALAQVHRLAVLVTAQVVTDHEDELMSAARLPQGVTEHADRVLVLNRPGAYWTIKPADRPPCCARARA
ncbi:hypothetical protein ACFRCW_44240 [Streptomyces sp. NPDC056653]|uniref:hypothetical protein n=1 Tax=Streptomyces sp. NPDC056653 TaxID=3345894 RepID=UPI0036CD4B53